MAYQKLQASRAKAITESDTADITLTEGVAEGCVLYVGTGGDLVVTTIAGDVVTFKNVPSGTFVPVQVRKLMAASSVADVVALW